MKWNLKKTNFIYVVKSDRIRYSFFIFLLFFDLIAGQTQVPDFYLSPSAPFSFSSSLLNILIFFQVWWKVKGEKEQKDMETLIWKGLPRGYQSHFNLCSEYFL